MKKVPLSLIVSGRAGISGAIRRRARALAALTASVLVLSCAALVDLQKVEYGDVDAAGAAADGGVDDARDGSSDVVSGKKDGGRIDAGVCGVGDDGKLYCTNRANASLYAQPTTRSAVVNTLRSTSSIFVCWTSGELHAGGNTTWYYTNGDDNPSFGWIPGVDLNTADAFDADPSAYGLRRCNP
jgi:hypothetical protein